MTTHDRREIALEYDIVPNRWTKLPRSPLSFRYGSALQWTGTELPPAPLTPTDVPAALWTGREMVLLGRAPGGDTFPLVAYDPATAKWQTLTDVPPSALARLQDDVSAYSSFVGNQAIFGIVSPGGQFAGFTYTIR